MPSLPFVITWAVVCTLGAVVPAAAEPPEDVDRLLACARGPDDLGSYRCASTLEALSKQDLALAGDPRVHRALAERMHRDVADFKAWQQWLSTRTQDFLERESPEYEDGWSTLQLADTIRVHLLPHAGPDTKSVLFSALLAAAVMNDEMERGLAKYGRPALLATLGQVRSDDGDRRRIAYSVLGWMLDDEVGGAHGSPLTSADRELAERAIGTGLQEADPDLRLEAIRAAQRGRVAGALPMLRVLVVTMPDAEPYRLRRAAIDAVVSLTR